MNNSIAQKETFTGKSTLYFHNEAFGNIVKVEAAEVRFWRGPFAQYANAVFVEFRQPRQRKFRCVTQCDHLSLLILEGWGHPEPDSFLAPAQMSDSDSPFTVARSRYPSFDPRWAQDFDAKINAHIAKKAPRIIADFRDGAVHNRQ